MKIHILLCSCFTIYMDSSDDSFVWAETSHESSDSVKMKISDHNSIHDEESGYSYKEKIQKELFDNGPVNESATSKKKKKRKLKGDYNGTEFEEPKAKLIKLEPESDNDAKKKTKQKAKQAEMYMGDASESVDESYLNMRVKQEESFAEPKPKKKKKKDKRVSQIVSGTDVVETDITTDKKLKKSKHKKKDRKYSISNESNHSNNDSMIIEDKFSADETVVEQWNATKSESSESGNDDPPHTTKKKKDSKKRPYDSISNESNHSNNDSMIIEDKFSADETAVELKRSTKSDSSESGNEAPPHTTKKDLKKRRNRALYNVDNLIDDITDTQNDFSFNVVSSTHIDHTLDGENPVNYKERNCIDEVRLGNDNILAGSTHKQTKKRTSKLSDRIRFEDDDNNDINEEQMDITGSVQSKKIKHFLKTKSNLVPFLSKSSKDCVISEDDEIWIMKCPHEINTANLLGTHFTLNEKCKIKMNGQTYCATIHEHVGRMPVLSMVDNKYVIKNIPVQSAINFRKRIPKAHIPEENIMVSNVTTFIPLPETKCRHPLFGSNYKKAIKVSAATAERLKSETWNSETRLEKKVKHKKVKKEKRHVSELSDQESKVFVAAEPEILYKKKKKHRQSLSEEGPPVKKVKRTKHDPNSAEAWESEKAIEENLFNF